jgi:UDP-N-acetylmuramate dehydrogenase
MNIQKNISLANYTTLRLGGSAAYFVVVVSDSDLREALTFARSQNLSLFPLGGGSNIVVSDQPKDILVVKMENRDIDSINEDDKTVTLRVGAGTLWDDFVEYAVLRNFSGIEALSMIPGTCGASPVQNIGAYGQEVSDTISVVRILDLDQNTFREISGLDCKFYYRDSIFKHELKGKCIIESVVFVLQKSEPTIPKYPRVADVLREIQSQNSTDSLGMLIRKSIQKIRSEKLPDPRIIPSVGSFFKNVFVEKSQYEKLLEKFRDMPYFVSEDRYKVPTGWLIEKAGYKGYSENGVGVYEKNALVLINISSSSTKPLLDLSAKIQKTVQKKFGLKIEIEPEIVY